MLLNTCLGIVVQEGLAEVRREPWKLNGEWGSGVKLQVLAVWKHTWCVERSRLSPLFAQSRRFCGAATHDLRVVHRVHRVGTSQDILLLLSTLVKSLGRLRQRKHVINLAVRLNKFTFELVLLAT